MAELNEVLREGFTSLPTQTWIPVIPQIFARLKTQNPNLMKMVRFLLGRVSENYPEALVFPIIAALDGCERATNKNEPDEGQIKASELLADIALRHPVRSAKRKEGQ